MPSLTDGTENTRGTPNPFRVLRLALREACVPRTLPRTPEPVAEMTSPESVGGFHDQGGSSLLPIYHFNALAIDGLVPRGGRVVDLGSGTGRFLAYLASHRPDLHITGLDVSDAMVRLGRRELARAGLDARVRLLHGDMREFRKLLPAKTDLVSSIFSLHHLTTRNDLLACLREIAATIVDKRALLWIFDHARPRSRRTAEEVSEIFTPAASAAFRQDSRNSLCASWSFGELRAALRETLPVGLRAAKSRLLPLYQAHWSAPSSRENPTAWVGSEDLPVRARREARILSGLFRAPRKIRPWTDQAGLGRR
jgi:tRNA (cmo5U34)-methyltransferase